MLLVLVNAAAFLILRERMTQPPGAATPPTTVDLAPVADDDGIKGPLFLSAAPDGTALRVTRGSCAAGNAAAVAVAPPGAGMADVQVRGLVEALAIGHAADSWWIVGTDKDCAVAAWTSPHAGQRWKPAALPAGAWYLDPADATTVISPRGSVGLESSCRAASVQTSVDKAFVTCADGRLQVAARSEPEFATFGAADQIRAVAVGPSGRLAMAVSRPTCGAAVVAFTEDNRPAGSKCFGNDKAPLGIAWAGGSLVAQIGHDLVTNAGGTWTVRD